MTQHTLFFHLNISVYSKKNSFRKYSDPMKFIIFFLLCVYLFNSLPVGYIPLDTEIKNFTVHVVPHSHWDVGWVQTSDSYFLSVKNILDRFMEFMKTDQKIKLIISEM